MTYQSLKEDPRAWWQSGFVVSVVALSHGVGAILRSPSQGYDEPALFIFLFGFVGEILLWFGTSASIYLGARMLSPQSVSFGNVARPLGFAAAPGIGVVVAGALSGAGRSALPLLVVMGSWRLAASFVAVRKALVTRNGKTAAWLILGLVGGMALMGAGTALLNFVSSGVRRR